MASGTEEGRRYQASNNQEAAAGGGIRAFSTHRSPKASSGYAPSPYFSQSCPRTCARSLLCSALTIVVCHHSRRSWTGSSSRRTPPCVPSTTRTTSPQTHPYAASVPSRSHRPHQGHWDRLGRWVISVALRRVEGLGGQAILSLRVHRQRGCVVYRGPSSAPRCGSVILSEACADAGAARNK